MNALRKPSAASRNRPGAFRTSSDGVALPGMTGSDFERQGWAQLTLPDEHSEAGHV